MNEARPPSGVSTQPGLLRRWTKYLRGKPGGANLPLLAALSRPAGIAALVLLLGFAATLFAWRTVQVREDRLVVERFDSIAAQLMSVLGRHQGVHEQSLRAGAALVSIIDEKDGVELNAEIWRAVMIICGLQPCSPACRVLVSPRR